MANAAILKYTKVVQTTNLSDIQFDLGGFLVGFKISGIKYVHSNKDDFRREDQNTIYASGGYYQEEFFLKYLAKEISAETLQTNYQLKNNSLPLAVSGDTVKVQKLKLVEPFADFCKVETFSWTYDIGSPIIDSDFNIIIPAPSAPGYSVATNTATTDSHADAFFDHKITLFVDSNQPDKQQRALLIAKIALNVDRINRDIFSLFTTSSNPNFATYISSQNAEWTALPVFSNPTVQDFQEYLINISSFYESAYSNQLLIQSASDDKKLYWLARALSVNGLSVISVYDKLKLLKLIVKDYVTEWNENEQLVLNITESISVSQGNEFLDGLLFTSYEGNKELTLFQILFEAIDDDRLSRYTFGIFSSENNRMKFIVLLYKIWKSSRYNPFFQDALYIEPANSFGIFPESHFMELESIPGSSIQKTKHYNDINVPPLLSYDSISDSTDNYLRVTDISYSFEFNGRKILVYRTNTSSTLNNNSSQDDNQYVNSFTSLYGSYSLYQPISILGFKPDLGLVETLKDPETGINFGECIPVFLVLYMEDFRKLKKIDFGVMLAAELALNFTGIGGLSNLRYISYLSKMRGVVMGTASASDAVLAWSAVTGVNNLVQFSAGTALAISNYTAQTTTDPDIQEFCNRLNVLLAMVTIASLSANPAIKRKVFDAGAAVLAQERSLILMGKTHGLSTDTMNAIRGLYDIDALIDLMQLKLNNLPSYANDTVLPRFSAFSSDDKYNFFTYFYNTNEEGRWVKMNFQHSRVVNGSAQSYTLVDVWKNEIVFFKNFRTFELVEVFNFIAYDIRCNWLREHIFKGHVKSTGSVGGIHSYVAVSDGYAQIDQVLTTFYGGYYEARVSAIQGSSIFPKTANGGVNSMLPNSWSKQKVLEELSYAFNNKFKKPGTNNQFVGEFSDGQKCIICITGSSKSIDHTTKIITFWPDLN